MSEVGLVWIREWVFKALERLKTMEGAQTPAYCQALLVRPKPINICASFRIQILEAAIVAGSVFCLRVDVCFVLVRPHSRALLRVHH